MATPLRFAVLTSSDIEAGMVVHYLIRRTGLCIERIYYDTLADRKKKIPGPSDPREEIPSHFQKLRWHLALACRLRRYYFWRMLEKVTGWPQLRFLRSCERISPSLFRMLCGVAFDPSLAGQGRLLFTLKEAAALHQITLATTPNINNPETVRSLAELKPDVIIGLGTRILSKEVLATANIGVLNGHSSLLPAYRGATTEFWQLAGGETQTGVTIHWMLPRVDQGDICAQRSWQIPPAADHHLLRLMSIFYRLPMWAEVINGLQTGTLPRRPQGSSRTPTFRQPTLRQEYDFYCRGMRRQMSVPN